MIDEYGFENIAYVISNKFEGQIDTGKTMLNLLKLAQKKGVSIINGVEVNRLIQLNNEVEIKLKKQRLIPQFDSLLSNQL